MAATRRDFIRNGLIALSVGVATPSYLLRTAHASGRAAAALRQSAPRTLVVIELAGGNDGLNTVVPYADEAYYRVRPTLHIKREEAHVITPELALHPALAPLVELYQAGRMAIIQGVGYPDPNYSHFRAMEILKSAVPERYEPVGWLGRYLDLAAGQADDHFAGVRAGGGLDHALRATEFPTPVIASPAAYSFQTDPRFPADRTNRLNAFQALNRLDSGGRAMLPLVEETAQAAYVSARELGDLVKGYNSAVTYPERNGLAAGLKLLAQVITADVGLRVGYVTLGGFDTHAAQQPRHRELLDQLAQAVRAFQDDIDAHGMADRVLILTTSEFGRRVAENGSAGTDHGSAEPFFVFGAPVRGGVYGDRPSLTDLDNGNFKHTTDFRSVYATVLRDWLKGDAAAVLGRDWPTIGFVA
ncbi:MAG: DUF1501 domain-containing protein [Dehalococcoidia bacterium]